MRVVESQNDFLSRSLSLYSYAREYNERDKDSFFFLFCCRRQLRLSSLSLIFFFSSPLLIRYLIYSYIECHERINQTMRKIHRL